MRGDVYLADLNPSRGSEQAGIQRVTIQFRSAQDTCRDGDLSRLKNPKLLPVALNPSVLIDKQRLIRKLGSLSPNYLLMLKVALDYTLQLDNDHEENAD
ncbi:MAG: type II toxin-antitoxin system PemK/MazF family toxin [Nostoc sp.]|uniref:type II toxin-antitoxin system PemK/MazF family toxin n=1 Tax=Nostoc sp. TaxID=1180 RepID=UPI002FF510B4